MKITCWNCLGPRYNHPDEIEKWEKNIKWLIQEFEANLYVIQECSKLQVDKIRSMNIFKYAAWYGDDIDYFMRGTAIFSNVRYFTEREEFFHNPSFRYVVPYHIHFDDELDFILFNIWTKTEPKNNKYKNLNYFVYENNVKEALLYYTNIIQDKTFNIPKANLLIGDFNFGQNVNYVKTAFLKEISKYNYKIADGLDDDFFTYIKGHKKYFNDYCFTHNLNAKLIKAGSFHDIINRSDHIPLQFEITK